MKILLNGEEKIIAAQTLAELLQELALTGKRVAIEHNGHIAPRSQHSSTPLCENDRVEIVHAIGGG